MRTILGWLVFSVATLATVGTLSALTAPLPAVRQVWLAQPPVLGPLRTPLAQERHDKHKDDADAYCFNPSTSGSQRAARERDPHGHRCSCHLTCQMGAAGEVTGDTESNDCELYCTRERCTCHVESPCEMPK
jgi:hypothetical protein